MLNPDSSSRKSLVSGWKLVPTFGHGCDKQIHFEGQDKFYFPDPISKIKKGGGEGIKVILTPQFIHRQ